MNKSFEYEIASYCSPTLAGIKPASLFACLKSDYKRPDLKLKYYNFKINCRGIYFETLYECDKRLLILTYNKELLYRHLKEKQTAFFLLSLGYPDIIKDEAFLDDMIFYLKKRVGENKCFPHEIGLFLGYPLEDVIGFIENKGQNFKLCGYWKVYSNEEDAKKLFLKYIKCKKSFCKRINSGMSITQILNVS